jgi:RNA polymerase sigma-70 factor (ECF subfamily)
MVPYIIAGCPVRKGLPILRLPADNAAPDDFELMRRIADGDSGALAQFYDKFSPLVFAVGMRFLHDRQEAEDLLIDVFWEIWDRCDRYDPARGAPINYLMNLSRSRAIDRQRSRSFRQKLPELSQAFDQPAAGGDPSDSMAAGEQTIRIRAALQTLDGAQRQAVELAFFSGLSHSEIAASMNKPLGTVKTYIRQGLIRLRDCLRKDE